MAKAKHYVVRVRTDLFPENAEMENFLECLRYTGVICRGSAEKDRSSRYFDIYPPRGVYDEEEWANSNVDRMTTFGYDCHKVQIK